MFSVLARRGSALCQALFVKSEFRHWIMLPVARPERRSSLHSAGSDQRVSQLNRMTLAVASQVFSGTTAHGGVHRDAEQSAVTAE